MLDALTAVLRRLPPETAHRLAVRALATGWIPATVPPDRRLATRLFGLGFPSPVGVAAGLDKNAEAFTGLLRLGAGFVEVGTLTPRPQPGNPRPRLFRLSEDRAVINRYGFNNDGLAAAAARLAGRDAGAGIVAVNLGANRDSRPPDADYLVGIRAMAPLADMLVINVSSPNTPGLRGLQDAAPLRRLLAAAREALAAETRQPPLLLKIAPDLDDSQAGEIVAVALEQGIAGLVIGNTTLARPPCLRSRNRREAGGLSGPPLFDPSTRLLARVHRIAGPRLPLIGVGGIEDAETAWRKIRAGASLVQVCTGLVWGGPGVLARINRGLADRLRRDGFASPAAAVGIDAGADRVAAAPGGLTAAGRARISPPSDRAAGPVPAGLSMAVCEDDEDGATLPVHRQGRAGRQQCQPRQQQDPPAVPAQHAAHLADERYAQHHGPAAPLDQRDSHDRA